MAEYRIIVECHIIARRLRFLSQIFNANSFKATTIVMKMISCFIFLEEQAVCCLLNLVLLVWGKCSAGILDARCIHGVHMCKWSCF